MRPRRNLSYHSPKQLHLLLLLLLLLFCLGECIPPKQSMLASLLVGLSGALSATTAAPKVSVVMVFESL